MYAFLLLLPVLCQDGVKVGDEIRIRVRRGDGYQEMQGVLEARDDKKIVLREKFTSTTFTWRWEDLHPDSKELLARGLPTRVEPREGLTVPGILVKTKDGKVFEGLELPSDTPGQIVIKMAGQRAVLSLSDVATKEPVHVPIERVYTTEEVIRMIYNEMHPVTAEEYDRVARLAMKIKQPELAIRMEQIAEILRTPHFPEHKLFRDLIKLRDAVRDVAIQKLIYDTQIAGLAANYEEVLKTLDAVEKGIVDAKLPGKYVDEITRMRAEVNVLRALSIDEQIVNETYRSIEVLLRTRALDRTLAYADAVAYAKEKLGADALRMVASKFNLKPDDPGLRDIWGKRSPDVKFKHSYGDATWVVERVEMGDRNAWWDVTDNTTRYALLKGLFIEYSGMMKVERTDRKNCPTCGAAGVVETRMPTNTCPSCMGLKKHRILIYR